MKIIRYDNAPETNTFTNTTTLISHDSNTFDVLDVSGFAVNDFILVENVGHEKVEIVKILNISGNTFTTENFVLPHDLNVSVTKLNYDKFKITRKITPAGTETDVVEKKFDYANPFNIIEYFDNSLDASDSLYYSIYYVNSHTLDEDLQVVLNKEENYGYINVEHFRRETSFTEDEITTSEIERAVYQSFEWIRDNTYVRLDFDGDMDDVFNIVTDMELADWNGDRVIDKRDIILYEFDSTTMMRQYLSNKIIKVSADTKKIFLKERIPLIPQHGVVIKIPLTFNKMEYNYQALANVSKLIATNFILKDVDISKIKNGITSWTAGGTTVSRDVNNIKDSIDKNLAMANQLLSQLRKIYMVPTKMRTMASSLNIRGRNRGFATGYEGFSRRF